jgi:hypothetical protein
MRLAAAVLAAAAPAAAAAAAAATCALSGTWVDRSGNVASIDVAADGRLTAKSVYGGTSWKTAKGAAAADGLSLWIDFARGNQTGTVVSNCSAIWWEGDGSVWGYAGDALAPRVTDVHLVFMSHLDLGYTDLMRNVCDTYFTALLPASMALAAQLRGSATPYALTTHAFLLAEYLDGAAGCAHARPNASALGAMRAAIAAGDLRWHAQSANYFPEALDAASFRAQLAVADGLNSQFGKAWGTLLMKSTDVAGLSRSVIPLLAAAGRRGVHMGTNAKITESKVAQAFTWAHDATGTALLALTTNDYGGWLVVPPHALFIQYQGDNGGPPTAAAVAGVYASAAAQFPGAAVALSSLDNFTAAVVASPTAGQLRVVSSELGDSWLYGAPSDPLKVAVFRETQRALDDAERAGGLSPADPDLVAFRRRLLLGGAEHNGGLSVGAYLPGARTPAGNWSNAQFHAVVGRADYAFLASSWAEKRAFLEPLPPAAGGGSPSPAWAAFLADRAARVAPILAPAPPDTGPSSGYAPVADPAVPVACGRLTAAFDASTGWLASVVDAATGWQWASPSSGGLLGFAYRTYTEANFTTFNEEYTPACGVPCPNFAHVGMDSAHPVAAAWAPSLGALYLRRNGSGGAPACEFAASLVMPPQTVAEYGGASSLWLEVGMDADATSAHPQLAVRLSWYGKTATRMAESSWLSVTPNVGGSASSRGSSNSSSGPGSGSGWWLDVLGSDVDPLDVVLYGTRHAHAVGTRGFGYNASSPASPAFSVATLDAMLVAPGDTNHLLHFDGAATPDVAGGGFHVNLHNNLWGTAFPQWFGDDAAFRFLVTLAAPAAAAAAAGS